LLLSRRPMWRWMPHGSRWLQDLSETRRKFLERRQSKTGGNPWGQREIIYRAASSPVRRTCALTIWREAMKIAITAAIVVAFTFLARPVSPQDPAPIEKCRADLASWTHDFSYTDTNRTDAILSYQQLKDRSAEANQCALMDDKEPYHGASIDLQGRYSTIMRDRLYDFLVRHSMTDQFQKEDANGLR
jgi:hypothetical protein